MLTYIKALVITTIIGGNTYKQYIFDDYILKEHTYGTDELTKLVDNRYQIIDFNSNIVYAIPLNEEYKISHKKNPKHQKGGWIVEGKRVGGVEKITKVKFQDYDCVKVIRQVASNSPFGVNTYFEIQHLLDIRKLPGIGKNWKKIRLYIGNVDWEFKPPSFIVYSANDFGDDGVFPIIQTTTSYEDVDRSLLDRLLALPTKEYIE